LCKETSIPIIIFAIGEGQYSIILSIVVKP
jgi:hypothetical protein